MTRGGSSWRVPLALVLLSLIPVISGLLRLIEAAGGPELMPVNPRIAASRRPWWCTCLRRPFTPSSARSSSPLGFGAGTRAGTGRPAGSWLGRVWPWPAPDSE
jgi:hypothetical protein